LGRANRNNPYVLRVTALVISIGLADSLNPTTIGPALFLAGGPRARREVTRFTIAVFLVYLVGGAAFALGIGQLVLSLVPRPDREDQYVLEIVAGAVVLTAGAIVWGYRNRLAKREVPMPNPEGKSSAFLGATITAIELPTAFPYFAAIAAIVGSGLNVAQQALLLVVFNVCFVLPLIGIVAVVAFAPGNRAEDLLGRGRRWLEARWPAVLATLGLVAGIFVMFLGISGLAGQSHNHVGGFFRHLRKLLHP
jgi:cytochrome c biogenesis protein CcdA